MTRHLLTKRADVDGVDVRVVERDYVLAHVVSQLHLAKPADGGHLVFKGGTALRFVHIADYRYSADLDFTVVHGNVDTAIAALSTAVEAAKAHAGLPHLDLVRGNPATLAYIGPLGAAEPRTVKLDIAADEYVETVQQATVFTGLWDDLPEPLAFDVYGIDGDCQSHLPASVMWIDQTLVAIWWMSTDMWMH